MICKRLMRYTEAQYEDLAGLMHTLTQHRELTPRKLDETLQHAQLFVLEGEDGRLVGMATLCPFFSPTGRKASIEDVVIHPDYQGKGLGRLLMQEVLSAARELSPLTLQLTSRPSRIAANALYRKLGFQQKDTNFYYMEY